MNICYFLKSLKKAKIFQNFLFLFLKESFRNVNFFTVWKPFHFLITFRFWKPFHFWSSVLINFTFFDHFPFLITFSKFEQVQFLINFSKFDQVLFSTNFSNFDYFVKCIAIFRQIFNILHCASFRNHWFCSAETCKKDILHECLKDIKTVKSLNLRLRELQTFFSFSNS